MKLQERDIFGGRRDRRTLGRVCAALAFFGVASLGNAIAYAQPVQFQMLVAERLPDERSANELFRWHINREECENDKANFRFNLNVNGWDLNETLEVWGSFQYDCTDPMYRDGLVPDCKRLKTLAPNGTTVRAETIEVLVKDLVDVDLNDPLSEDCGASTETTTARTLGVYFILTASGTVVDGSALKWPPTGVMWQSQVDMWGPAPPTSVTAASQEAAIELTLEGSVEQNTTPIVYCAKDGVVLGSETTESDSSCSCFNVGDDSGSGGSAGNATGGSGGSAGSSGTNASSSSSSGSGGIGGSGGAGGAGGASGMGGSGGMGGAAGMGGAGGASGMGGSGGMGSSSSSSSSSVSSSSSGTSSSGGSGGGSSSNGDTCETSPLVANEVPDKEWKICAEGTTVEDLENNQVYAMAVAYKDQVGNVGKLSEVFCATPEPIEDFFENYRNNGGTAGGGFCSIAPRTLRNTTFGTSFAVTALALVMRRRSRQSRLVSSKEVSK